MALNFPGSPTNGQQYQGFVYNSSVQAWQSNPASVAPFYTADLPPTNPTKGDSWFNTNDGTMYIYTYDGNTYQWVEHRSEIARSQVGIVPLVPGSVSVASGTATVSSNGIIEFSGATSISVNNVFNSSFNSYKIIFSCQGSVLGGAVYLRTRNAGTDRSTSNHYQGGRGARETGGDITIALNGSAAFDINRTIINNPYGTVTTMDIINPYSSTSGTTCNWSSWCNDSSGGFGFTGNGLYSIAGQSDGFTVFVTSGNFTGRVKIYGYN